MRKLPLPGAVSVSVKCPGSVPGVTVTERGAVPDAAAPDDPAAVPVELPEAPLPDELPPVDAPRSGEKALKSL
jgi:hypothetical protein